MAKQYSKKGGMVKEKPSGRRVPHVNARTCHEWRAMGGQGRWGARPCRACAADETAASKTLRACGMRSRALRPCGAAARVASRHGGREMVLHEGEEASTIVASTENG